MFRYRKGRRAELMRDYKQECDKFEAANKILQRENEVKNKEDELKKLQSKILKDKDKLELKKRVSCSP